MNKKIIIAGAGESDMPFLISAKKKDNATAEVRIVGMIGWESTAESFRTQVDLLISAGITHAELFINSPGGSCFDANEIVNILQKFRKVTGKGGALVASAATFIACHCDTFEMPENGMFMIHPPSIGVCGKVADIESTLKLLRNIELAYYKVYKNKTTDTKEFKANWNANKDWWLTAKEAKDMGFVTSIAKKIPLDAQSAAMLTACSAPITQHTNLKNDMNIEILKAALGMDIQSESDVISAFASLKNENSALKGEKKTLEDKITAMEAAGKAVLTTEATTLVEDAIKAGKIKAEQKESYLKLFAADHESTKAILANLPARQSVADAIAQAAAASQEQTTDDLSKFGKMSYDELDRGNFLVTVKANYPDLFKSKFKEKFGKEPTE